jgi:ubiquitin-conjugating enzyme (huntingtin interacting protein 2)
MQQLYSDHQQIQTQPTIQTINIKNTKTIQDILKDQWSPALTVKTAMLSLQALLCSPEPNDPQDAQVARMYLSNKSEFDQHAKYWTEMYASEGAKEKKEEGAIDKVCEMGFSRDDAREALVKYGWDKEAAVNSLLGM